MRLCAKTTLVNYKCLSFVEEFKYADKMFMEEDGFVNDISRKGYKYVSDFVF